MQDVGLLREVKAMKKPGCPVCGPRGVAYDQGQRSYCALQAPCHHVSGCQDCIGLSVLNVHGWLQSATAQPNMLPEIMAIWITKTPQRLQTVVTRVITWPKHPLPGAHHQMVMRIRVKTEQKKLASLGNEGDKSVTMQRR